MSAKRKTGSVAAIGPTIALAAAAFVLLAALPATRADDLPDLRAHQQLSQLRIDHPPPDQAPNGSPNASSTSGSTAYGATTAPAQPSAGGGFPRSFQIPGTSTSIRVGGSIDESVHSRLDR
ncbi:MAG: hypothetical protein ACREE9_04195 [Stellaceae bacterium]